MGRRIHVRFPEHLAGLRIEGAELRVKRRANEHQAARGCDRAAHVRRAGVLHTLFLCFRKTPEWHAPRDLSGVGVDRDEFAPWRILAGPLRLGIPETESRGVAFAEWR